MLLTCVMPELFGFGDRTFALWCGNPYALARTALRQALLLCIEDMPAITGLVLDVGCGSMPYRKLFGVATAYHGLEIDQPRNHLNPNVTHWYNGGLFPMANSTYQVVICSQVLEHTFDPDQLLAEAFRVLQAGGYLLLTIPFFWPEHEQPFDSQRFTSYGLTYRLEQAGFELCSLRRTNPGLPTLLQLTIEWLESIVRRLLSSISFERLKSIIGLFWRLFSAFPYAVLNLTGSLYRRFVSVGLDRDHSEFFLDLVVIARKP